MSWFSSLFSSGAGDLIKQVGDVADRFITTDAEKQQFKLQMQNLVQQRHTEMEQTLRTNLEAKERILVAELTQGDAYTKRARPTVVYAGLAFIGINYVLVPIIGQLFGDGHMQPFELPMEFWAGWSGIVATWSLGRSYEKRGASSNLSRAITGSKPASSLLDNSVG